MKPIVKFLLILLIAGIGTALLYFTDTGRSGRAKLAAEEKRCNADPKCREDSARARKFFNSIVGL